MWNWFSPASLFEALYHTVWVFLGSLPSLHGLHLKNICNDGFIILHDFYVNDLVLQCWVAAVRDAVTQHVILNDKGTDYRLDGFYDQCFDSKVDLWPLVLNGTDLLTISEFRLITKFSGSGVVSSMLLCMLYLDTVHFMIFFL